MEYKLETKPSRWKKEYDDGRKYNKKWELQFPWLAESEDSRPFCQWCNKYLIPRKHALTAHDRSTLHKKHAHTYQEAGMRNIQHEMASEHLVPVTSVPSMSMPSIEVLGDAIQTGQELTYTNENGTVFTYVEGASMHTGDGPITYFTEAPAGNDQLSGVIKECFTVRDDTASYITSTPQLHHPQSIVQANGHNVDLSDESDELREINKKKRRVISTTQSTPIQRKVSKLLSPQPPSPQVFKRKTNSKSDQRRSVIQNENKVKVCPPFPLQSQLLGKPSVIPTKLYDQHFGGVVSSDNCNSASSSIYMRGNRGPRETSGVSEIFNKPTSFEVHLEVPHFNFSDLRVRINGKMLEIVARHEEKEDEFGTIFRHLVRKYALPDDAIVENISSSLSSSGVLVVEMPKKQRKSISKEVPIMIRREDSLPGQIMPVVQHEEIIDTGIHVANSL